MPRRRRINNSLPPNLYCSKKGHRYYYRYRNPETGKETGMGTEKAAAIKAAHELNARLSLPLSIWFPGSSVAFIGLMGGWTSIWIFTRSG